MTQLPSPSTAPPVPSATSDPEAFARAYVQHHAALHRYCATILRDDHDAQDALQSAVTKAFAAFKRGPEIAELRPWLFRIAHNEAISLLRARSAAQPVADPPDRPGEPLSETVERRERLAHLDADLAALPERQRSALVLRELNGLGHDEIAAVLSSTPRAVKQTIYEARVALLDAEAGRAMSCTTVQRALSDGDGRVRRGRRMRGHLRGCPQCRRFVTAIEHRPSDLAAMLPPLPPVAAAALLTHALGGGGAATGAGCGAAALTGTGATGAGGVALGAAATTGGSGAALTAAAGTVAGGAAVALPPVKAAIALVLAAAAVGGGVAAESGSGGRHPHRPPAAPVSAGSRSPSPIVAAPGGAAVGAATALPARAAPAAHHPPAANAAAGRSGAGPGGRDGQAASVTRRRRGAPAGPPTASSSPPGHAAAAALRGPPPRPSVAPASRSTGGGKVARHPVRRSARPAGSSHASSRSPASRPTHAAPPARPVASTGPVRLGPEPGAARGGSAHAPEPPAASIVDDSAPVVLGG